mmetsp:Transcript_17385/g.24554  ORF Transcript_17385/g.24554 Transcript_17385/m.24554 type:complete len:119 (+) Transcript_17385:1922-2278(+)
MQLQVDSDAAYLILPKARSRYAGYFYLGANISNNGPVHVECKIIPNVVTSSAEAECAGVYHNTHMAIIIRWDLETLGHKQHPTTVLTDNSTACAFANNDIKLQRSKTWDKNYWWLLEK